MSLSSNPSDTTTKDLARLRRTERADLLATLRSCGPGAPTLCAGWTAADVAAHLATAERYLGLPLAALYPLRKALPERAGSRLMGRLRAIGDRQTRAEKARGWQRSLARLGQGPPRTYDLPSLAPIRLAEEWIHHEDVRRADASGPRRSDVELEQALWHSLVFLSGFPEFSAGRRLVEAVLPDGRSLRLGDGPSRAKVTGPAGELLLFLGGRCRAADVEVDAPDTVRAELETALGV